MPAFHVEPADQSHPVVGYATSGPLLITSVIMEVKSTTEIKILQFIMNYGSETIISWLDHFDSIITAKDYPLYRRLEKEACNACEITLSDMRRFSNAPCTNAKRIIALVSYNQIGLSVCSIAKLLNVSDRTINYYMKESGEWLSQPKSNKIFIEAYNKVVEGIKIT